ncbi:MAG: alcohol dehydrogenase catalytic domain-containing protein [Magnetococcales bacterium]|nr:alcohol dehydrogenase catalytic domain-containing protein [Magnetococcales bacterium]
MRALVYDQGRLTFDCFAPVPTPLAGEALIAPSLMGVCATDQAILNGYGGFRGVLGHEFVGRVVAAPGHPEWQGRRVVGEISITCHVCPACRRGDFSHCLQRTVLGIRGRDGVFAQFFTLPIANLHPVPDALPDEAALFTEPLAAALEILQQVHIPPDARVAVVGDGKLGLLVAQVVALTGCELLVIGRHPEKWRVLQSRGIPVVTTPQAEGEWDVVVECSGSPSGFALARRLVRPRGRIVLKSALLSPLPLDLAGLTVDEITLTGSRCGPFPAALRLLERKLVAVTPLLTAIYPLEQGVEALRQQVSGASVIKIALRP